MDAIEAAFRRVVVISGAPVELIDIPLLLQRCEQDLMAQIDEAQGNQEGALEALTKSSEIIPSARRSRNR